MIDKRRGVGFYDEEDIHHTVGGFLDGRGGVHRGVVIDVVFESGSFRGCAGE